MEMYELVYVEWSDYGDEVEVLATSPAEGYKEAALLFRLHGPIGHLYIRKQGSTILLQASGL